MECKKEENREKHISMIALTGYALKEEEDRCREAGMNGFLTKPIQRNEFFRVIDELVSTQTDIVPSQTDVHPEVGVLDQSALMTVINGDTDFLKEVVHLFIKDLPDQMAAIQNAVEKEDGLIIEDISHALKGRCAQLFALDAAEAAGRLEEIGRSGDLTEAKEAYAAFEKEVARLKLALGSII